MKRPIREPRPGAEPRRLQGLGISPGEAMGCVCLFAEGRHNNIPVFKLSSDAELARERQRFVDARQSAIDEIARLETEVGRRLGANEAAIFFAHRAILTDPGLEEKVFACLDKERMNVEYCLVSVFNGYEEVIAQMDDEYLRERGTDFAEIRRRLLDRLTNMNPRLTCRGEVYCSHGRGRVTVANELTPALTVEIECEEAQGFVTAHGGKASHAAILANALGIPAVTGIHGFPEMVACGTIVYLNGDTGEVWIDPPPEVRDAYEARRIQVRAEMPVAPREELGVRLLANVNDETGAHLAVEMGAEGAGLVRTEYLFMESSAAPNEDVQYAHYAGIVKVLGGRTVTFRLLDIGGDKPVPYLDIGHEDNPYLGWRGTRFLLDHPDTVRTQVRAIARAAAHGPVEIMYPMVADLRELDAIQALVRSAFAPGEWEARGIREGAMIEVPSIVFQLDAIAPRVGFFSIGTNDLIQYIFAVDRNNENVAGSYDPTHAVLWSIMENVAATGRRHGIKVSVCGEMAGMPVFAERFRSIGVTSLSMSPRMIPRVRRQLSKPPAPAGTPAT
ncbi:MAG: phosphoenolpyruvate--protein phosphotransferase [Planctomycetota bacterium]